MPSAPRDLPKSSAFAGDDGRAAPALTAAVAGFRAGDLALTDVVAALEPARVLVPVLAALEASGTTSSGLHVDKEASAGIVALQVPDGRTALPLFSSIDAMTAWRPDARPVPTRVPQAAAAALQEGWEVLVLDPGGPDVVVVPHPAVRALASGTRWLPAVHQGQVRADVRAAVASALSGLGHVDGADALPGRRAEVAVALSVRPGLDRAGVDGLLSEVNARLAADDVITSCVDSLEVRLRPSGR